MDIRAIWIDLLFLAMIFSLFTALICLLLRKVLKKDMYFFGIGIGSVITLLINQIVCSLPDYVLRLSNILSNAMYVLSFDKNRLEFFRALNITDSEENAMMIGKLVYYMDESDWERVISGTDNLKWYLERIQESLNRTVSFMGVHIGLPVYEITLAYLLVGILCVIFLILNRKSYLALFFIAPVMPYLFTQPFGSSIFFVAYLTFFMMLYAFKPKEAFAPIISAIKKRQKK